VTPAQHDDRSGLSRRTLISAAVGGAGVIMLGGVINPEAALAAVGGTIVSYDDNAPDPTNWRAARYSGHAGYPAWSGKYDSQGNKIGTERDCTNYVAWRLMFNGMPEPQVPQLGGAGQWDHYARLQGIPVNSTPAVGAVAQWSANDYHVAWVEQIYGDGTLLVSESDWPGASHWLDYRRLNVSQVENFIHINDGATTPAAPDPATLGVEDMAVGLKWLVNPAHPATPSADSAVHTPGTWWWQDAPGRPVRHLDDGERTAIDNMWAAQTAAIHASYPSIGSVYPYIQINGADLDRIATANASNA
jgi:surface antigen